MEQQIDRKDSRFSRRNMLFTLGGAIAAAGALVAAPVRQLVLPKMSPEGSGGGGTAPSVSLATAGYDAWLAQVGTTFAIGGGLTMVLQGVRPLPSGGARPANLGRSSAFVAMFDPVGRTTMAGDLIYSVSAGRSSPLSIFLTASSDPRTPARMLAVFN